METVAFLQSFGSPTLDHVMQFITDLGSQEAYIVLLLTFYLAVDARLGQRLGIFVLLAFFLNFHLKGLVNAPRPFELDPSLGRTPEAVATGVGPGFPSAHAQSSLTFWGYAALWFRKLWFTILAGTLVLLISLSRLYLGVHLPVDVLGGLLIGAVYLAVIVLAEPLWRRLRELSKGVRLALGLLLPFALLLLLPPPGQEPDLIMGALAAFLTGPLLMPYAATGPVWKRVLLALLGVVLVFGALIGSSLLLPEAVKRNPVGGFLRYLFIGYVGVVLTPWLGARVRLVAPPARRLGAAD